MTQVLFNKQDEPAWRPVHPVFDRGNGGGLPALIAHEVRDHGDVENFALVGFKCQNDIVNPRNKT